jgi:hypothetical protein
VKNILLIYPPLVKACEPPVGIARLAACVRHQGVHCDLWDANWEGQMALLQSSAQTGQDLPRTRQARSRMQEDLDYLRHPDGIPPLIAIIGGPPPQPSHAHRSQTVPPAPPAWRIFSTSGCSRWPAMICCMRPNIPKSSLSTLFFQEQLQRRLAQNGPDLIGLSLNYLTKALCAFSLIGMLRRMIPNVSCNARRRTDHLLDVPAVAQPFAGLVDDLVAAR